MNARVAIFAVVVAALVGYPAYTFYDAYSSGGIHDRGNLIEVDLKALSSFNFDQAAGTEADIPAKWRTLDGKRVQLEGEMVAPQSAAAGADFELVFSKVTCCMQGSPQIQHFIKCRASGTPPPVVDGLVRATGTLQVKLKRIDGNIVQVYGLALDGLSKR